MHIVHQKKRDDTEIELEDTPRGEDPRNNLISKASSSRKLSSTASGKKINKTKDKVGQLTVKKREGIWKKDKKVNQD